MVDGGVIDEGVPGLVGVFEWWLGGKVVAYFDCLCSAVAQIVDLVADPLMLGLKWVVPLVALVGTAVVGVRVGGGRGCGVMGWYIIVRVSPLAKASVSWWVASSKVS